MNFRFLNHSDTIAYKELRLISLQESPMSFSSSYEDEIWKTISDYESELEIAGSPAEQFVLGAFSANDELIGFVKFQRDTRSKARHKAFVHTMYIKWECRNRGYGMELISTLIKIAESITGLEQIHLWVLVHENSVISFYEKCGFECQGTLVNKDLKIGGEYIDAIYMVNYLHKKQSSVSQK